MSEKLSRQELIDLVELIVSGGYDKTTGKKCTEDEHVKMVVKFEKNINHPGGSDLIYYPELVGLPKNPTVEEIVDLAIKGIEETK
uniref:bacteriocin immunity protein n=1 Tax=Enterocloster clostridioformis TaxID=1531 RepID=UPI0026EA2307|nr:bacteriocin immunity protein [Enterocloster clostridioformis]